MEAGGLFLKKDIEVCGSSVSHPLGGMSTSDQQTSNTLMKTRADKAFTMKPISFTNLVCGNILSENIVSLTPMRKPIIQKLKKWPGQDHELHGSSQTTIREGNTVMPRQPLQPRYNL